MHVRRVTLQSERFPSREHYPFNLPVLQHTPALQFDQPVSFFVGENGSGKSTFQRAIAEACGIYIWGGEQRARFDESPYEGWLHRYLQIHWSDGRVPGSFFAAESFRSFRQILDDWATADPELLEAFGSRSLMSQSHGQSHMAYFSTRYRLQGIYFLDEPENALSPRRQLELVQILRDNAAKGQAQFIVATHSPVLLACPGARVFSFDQVPVEAVRYQDTEHYRVYRELFGPA